MGEADAAAPAFHNGNSLSLTSSSAEDFQFAERENSTVSNDLFNKSLDEFLVDFDVDLLRLHLSLGVVATAKNVSTTGDGDKNIVSNKADITYVRYGESLSLTAKQGIECSLDDERQRINSIKNRQTSGKIKRQRLKSILKERSTKEIQPPWNAESPTYRSKGAGFRAPSPPRSSSPSSSEAKRGVYEEVNANVAEPQLFQPDRFNDSQEFASIVIFEEESCEKGKEASTISFEGEHLETGNIEKDFLDAVAGDGNEKNQEREEKGGEEKEGGNEIVEGDENIEEDANDNEKLENEERERCDEPSGPPPAPTCLPLLLEASFQADDYATHATMTTSSKKMKRVVKPKLFSPSQVLRDSIFPPITIHYSNDVSIHSSSSLDTDSVGVAATINLAKQPVRVENKGALLRIHLGQKLSRGHALPPPACQTQNGRFRTGTSEAVLRHIAKEEIQDKTIVRHSHTFVSAV